MAESRTDPSLRRSAIVERLRESLAAACVGGLLVGVLAGAVLGRLPGPGLVQADQGQLLSLTATLLSAVMTVVGVVLSILVVAQQLASQQYSPRAIRTALRDRRTRAALAGMFAYVGLMLGLIEAIDAGPTDSLGVTVGLVGSVAVVGLVAYLVQRVTDGFRSDQLVARIGADTLSAVRRIDARDAEESGGDDRYLDITDVPDDARIVHSLHVGYLQDVAVGPLARDLHDLGVRVRLEVGVGDFVGRSTGLGWVWGRDGEHAHADHDRVEEVVAEHVRLGSTRTTQREVGSGVQQLVDVALRGLSPAINDPYTAVQAVNTLTYLLQELAGRRQRWLVGEVDDEVVLTVPRPLVWDFADYAVASIRRVAGRYPQVLGALVVLLRGIGAVRPEDCDRADPHLDAIEAEAERAGLLDVDVEHVRDVVARARRELGRRAVDAPPEADEEAPDR